MGEYKVTKEEVKDLKKIPGKVKGVVILANIEFLEQKGSEANIQILEERLKELELGYTARELKPMQFYPEYLSVTVVLLIKEILNLDDKGVFEMGETAMKLSFFIKVLTKFFVSVKKCFEESPKYWKKHFDFGELEAVEFNELDKYVILRVHGYKFHPIMSIYHMGYFVQTACLALGKKTVQIKETKSQFKGDGYDEYVISWV